MRQRLLHDESGFTLSEMLVTTMIMLVVVFALYSLFDATMRIYDFGNDKVEAVENARLGLEKMERELRAAYYVNGLDSTGAARYRFFNANGSASSPPAQMPNSSQITFGNDLGTASYGTITCGSPCEYITYKLTSRANPAAACTTSSAPCTLRRVNATTSTAAGDPVVDFVRPPVTGDASRFGLRFKYYTETPTGTVEINPTSPGTYTQNDIDRIEIAIQVDVDDRVQTLATEVDLRNEG